MTKQKAIAEVASHVAAYLWASDPDEIVATETEADRDRVSWAMEEVRRRLYKMGRSS